MARRRAAGDLSRGLGRGSGGHRRADAAVLAPAQLARQQHQADDAEDRGTRRRTSSRSSRPGRSSPPWSSRRCRGRSWGWRAAAGRSRSSRRSRGRRTRPPGGNHCSQLWRAATKAPKPASSTISAEPARCAPRGAAARQRRRPPARSAPWRSAARCTSGRAPGRPTCCRTRPNASSATQIAATAASTRRGAWSNQFRIFPVNHSSSRSPRDAGDPQMPAPLSRNTRARTRCRHQRVALAESHLPELLRRNLRLDHGIGARIVRLFGTVQRQKFQPGHRADHDGARQPPTAGPPRLGGGLSFPRTRGLRPPLPGGRQGPPN